MSSHTTATALAKITKTAVSPVKKIAIAYSGGVDSSLGVELAKRVYQAKEIHPIIVDVGQGDEEVKTTQKTALQLGVQPILLDAKEQFSEKWLPLAIQANSDYCGYPVSTSMTRQLIAALVAKKAKELACDAIMEGSTGKGNDQYRMHNVFKLFSPDLEVLVPVRDFDLTRQEEILLCKHWKVPVHEAISGGDDKTMWARSIASGAIDLNQKIPDEVWMWKRPLEDCPNQPDHIKVTFKQGVPIALNGKTMSIGAIVEELNLIGGQHGIGAIDICEDGIMGLKSRELYEAPAAMILLKIHQDLEAFCLTKEELIFKKEVDRKWAELTYHGLWYHPLKTALDAFIATTQNVVNGTLSVKLCKGTMEIVERNLPTSLFHSEMRSIHSTGFSQLWCKDAAKIGGLPMEILAQRQEVIS